MTKKYTDIIDAKTKIEQQELLLLVSVYKSYD